MKCNSLSVAVELEKMGLSIDWWFPNVTGVTRDCLKEHVEKGYPGSASRILELWDAGLWSKSDRNGFCVSTFDVIGIPLSLAQTFSEWIRPGFEAHEMVAAVSHALDVVSIMFPELPAPWVVADCLKGYLRIDCETFRDIVSMRVPESVMIPLLVCCTWPIGRSMASITCVAMVRSHIKLMADCFSAKEEENE